MGTPLASLPFHEDIGSIINVTTVISMLTLCLVIVDSRAIKPRVSVKGQILANFIVERPEEDSLDTPMEENEELPEPWILFTDGSSCTDGPAAGRVKENLQPALAKQRQLNVLRAFYSSSLSRRQASKVHMSSSKLLDPLVVTRSSHHWPLIISQSLDPSRTRWIRLSLLTVCQRAILDMTASDASLALRGLELNYTSMEKLVLALVHARPKVAGRLQKWSIELGEYAIHYRPRVSVKGQILADFIVERPEEEYQSKDKY
ncbi:hypothetical protein Tco_0716107 [Tanacetum coccineum]